MARPVLVEPVKLTICSDKRVLSFGRDGGRPASQPKSSTHADLRMSNELLYPVYDVGIGKVQDLQDALGKACIFEQRRQHALHLRDEDRGCGVSAMGICHLQAGWLTLEDDRIAASYRVDYLFSAPAWTGKLSRGRTDGA